MARVFLNPNRAAAFISGKQGGTAEYISSLRPKTGLRDLFYAKEHDQNEKDVYRRRDAQNTGSAR